jgi:hypothetical protein
VAWRIQNVKFTAGSSLKIGPGNVLKMGNKIVGIETNHCDTSGPFLFGFIPLKLILNNFIKKYLQNPSKCKGRFAQSRGILPISMHWTFIHVAQLEFKKFMWYKED